ncbi:MAG TPA: M28 family peptidase [Solirubrobacteraceae bacterium]|nr:M28 family peptidase [Solirubrobacteraceae bacterium]
MTASDRTLREVVHALSDLERRAGSPGEREAALWLAERLTRAGSPASVAEVDFLDGYALLLLPLGLAGLVAGGLHLSGRSRTRAGLLAAVASALVIDDVSNGRRLWRRLVGRRRRTWNVTATAGDPLAARTLVVLAHHDAAPTGRVFDQSFQRWLARRFPKVVARIDTSLPLWWPVVSGGVTVAAGTLLGSRKLSATGTALAGVVVALAADIARSPIVPGANDNLSAVAALVALAERLSADPPAGLRVLLVSCGAEEVIQGGIYAFAKSHFSRLPRESTWFVNLDTIGSPELLLVEGEGPFWMEDYCDPGFRDLIAGAAGRAGLPVRRGVRARASTDAVLPTRAGYPTATLASWEPDTKLLSNYHLMSDTPENLRFETVAHAVEVVHAVARELAQEWTNV